MEKHDERIIEILNIDKLNISIINIVLSIIVDDIIS